MNIHILYTWTAPSISPASLRHALRRPDRGYEILHRFHILGRPSRSSCNLILMDPAHQQKHSRRGSCLEHQLSPLESRIRILNKQNLNLSSACMIYIFRKISSNSSLPKTCAPALTSLDSEACSSQWQSRHVETVQDCQLGGPYLRLFFFSNLIFRILPNRRKMWIAAGSTINLLPSSFTCNIAPFPNGKFESVVSFVGRYILGDS